MAPDYLYIVFQTLFVKVIASYASPYIQYGTTYPTQYITGYPAQSYTPKPVYTQPYIQPTFPYPVPSNPVTPSYQPAAYQPGYPAKKAPTSHVAPTVPKSTSYQSPSPIAPVPKTPPKVEPVLPLAKEIPKIPKDLIPKPVPPFDTNILNNLAIALQLLIVSNLIHNPPLDLKSLIDVEEDIVSPAPLPIAYVPPNSPDHPNPHYHDPHSHEYQVYSMPNANFLGTSSFGDTGISHSMMGAYGSPTVAKPRPTGLMSPYDAIGPNSPYVDASSSKSSKSPYHLSSDYNDLFSLTELFKV